MISLQHFATEMLSRRRPVELSAITIPKNLRVAVTAPHPDDFDAIAVTMRLLHANGNIIDLAVLTSGTSGVDDGFAGAHTSEAKTRIREDEQRASCQLFGLDPSHLQFLRLTYSDDHQRLIGDGGALADGFIKQVSPDLIFLPHGNDTNRTHQRTHALITGIVKKEKLTTLLFLNEDPKTQSIRRDVIVQFGEAEAEWKARLLRLHTSQHERTMRIRGHGLDERILSTNRLTAGALGLGDEYSEAFELAYYEQGNLLTETNPSAKAGA